MKWFSVAVLAGFFLMVGAVLLSLLGIITYAHALAMMTPGVFLLFLGLWWGGIPPTEVGFKWFRRILVYTGIGIVLVTLLYSGNYAVEHNAKFSLLVFGVVFLALGWTSKYFAPKKTTFVPKL